MAVLPPPHARGMSVQVDTMKPTLKAPGAKRLQLKYDESLSSVAFDLNLRRYIVVVKKMNGGTTGESLHGRAIIRVHSLNNVPYLAWNLESKKCVLGAYLR